MLARTRILRSVHVCMHAHMHWQHSLSCFFSYVNLCICYCRFTSKKSSFGLEKPHDELMVAVLCLWRNLPRSIGVDVTLWGKLRRVYCWSRTCLFLHCSYMYSSWDLGGCWACSWLIVAYFFLFHANKVMRKDWTLFFFGALKSLVMHIGQGMYNSLGKMYSLHSLYILEIERKWREIFLLYETLIPIIFYFRWWLSTSIFVEAETNTTRRLDFGRDDLDFTWVIVKPLKWEKA